MTSHDGHSSIPRAVKDSQSQMAEVVLPNDTNPLGNLLGGRLLHMIDIAGALAAHRHSRSHVATLDGGSNSVCAEISRYAFGLVISAPIS